MDEVIDLIDEHLEGARRMLLKAIVLGNDRQSQYLEGKIFAYTWVRWLIDRELKAEAEDKAAISAV